MACEIPLNLIHLYNVTTIAETGAVALALVLHPMPPTNLEEMADHFVNRALDDQSRHRRIIASLRPALEQ